MSDLQLTRENSLKLKEELLKTTTDKTGKKMMNPVKLPEIFNYFDTPGREKKWTAPNADITDYFNYGLTEETFKIYCQKVKNLFTKLQKTGGAHFKNMGDSDKFFEDKIPISHGGLEIIDDKALKDYQEDTQNILYYENDKYLDQIFTSQDHASLDAVRKGIYEINGSVNNIYGLKKDPPPNPPTPLIQPPPSIPSMPGANFGVGGIPRPQPPQPRRANPPPSMPGMPGMPSMPSMPNMPNMPNMYPPPMHPHPMDYSGYPPHMMNRSSYMGGMGGMGNMMGNMGYPPKSFEGGYPMYPPGGMMMGRPPMEMPESAEMEDKRYEKKRRDSSSSESSDEAAEKSKKDRKKRSRSKEKKHKSHHRDKDSDHFEGKHHHKDRHDREDKSSKRRNSKEREREEVKYEGSYPQGMGRDDGQGKGADGRNRGAWQKGYINNLIGAQGSKDGRDRKDKRSK